MVGLEDYSDAELEEELRDRKRRRWEAYLAQLDDLTVQEYQDG